MNHSSEIAFKAWLEAEGIAIPVYTGLSAAEVGNEVQYIDCYAGDSEHVVGGLNKLSMKIVLSTPSHMDATNDETVSLAAHKDILTALRPFVADFESSQLETVYNAQSGHTLAGGFFQGEDESVDEGRWITTLNLMIGIR